MEEKLKEFEEYRVKVCKKANIYLFIGIALVVLGLLLVLLTELPIFVLFVIAGFIFIGISSNMKSKLSKEFKQKFIVNLVKEMYPNCIYNPNVGIHLEALLQPGFFARPDRWFLEDYLKASYDDVEFEMCDFTFQERHVTTDSKGNRRVTYVTYAQGRYMIFDFKREFNQILKVVENAYILVNGENVKEISTKSGNTTITGLDFENESYEIKLVIEYLDEAEKVIKVESDTLEYIVVTPEPQPKPEKPNGGCGKKGVELFVSLMAASAVIGILLRKRK